MKQSQLKRKTQVLKSHVVVLKIKVLLQKRRTVPIQNPQRVVDVATIVPNPQIVVAVAMTAKKKTRTSCYNN